MAKIGKQPKDDSAFGVRMVILQIVKAASQGFAELTVPAGLSGPVCAGAGGGVFCGSVGVLTQGSGFFFRCLLTSFRVSMIGVSRRGIRRR